MCLSQLSCGVRFTMSIWLFYFENMHKLACMAIPLRSAASTNAVVMQPRLNIFMSQIKYGLQDSLMIRA